MKRVINMQIIIHVFGDEESVKILKICREAITSKADGGKLIVVDIVINENKDEHGLTETKLSFFFFYMLIMVHVTAKEKTKK